MTNSIRVRARMLAEGRLYPNVVTPNGTRKLEQTVPDRLVDWPEDSFEGAYVLLLPSEEDQAKIGKMAALAWDMLHCTVAYLGSVEDLKVTGKELAETVKKLAADVEPIKAKLGGILRFTADNDYHLDPVVLNVDSPNVNELRDTVLRRMRHEHDIEPDDEHGYTPHLTLGYMQHSEPLITNRVEETEVTFDRLRVGYANQEFDIRLGSQAAREDREHLQPSVKAFMLNPFYNVAIEHKKRYVRTLAGQRRFGLPIGSLIVSDPVSMHGSMEWIDNTEHEAGVFAVDDALFGGMNVNSAGTRTNTKHQVVSDIANRLEEDLDAELLSRITGDRVSEPEVITNVGGGIGYVSDLRDAADGFPYWTKEAQENTRRKFGLTDSQTPAEYYEELMGWPVSEHTAHALDSTLVPRIQKLVDDQKLIDRDSDPALIRYNIVNSFVAEWATSSKDYNMQMLARNQFDLRSAQTEHLVDNYINHDQMSAHNPSEESSAAWKEAYGYYLDAVYEATQEKLEKEGIREVALYRGMNYAAPDYENRFGVPGIDIESAFIEANSEFNTGEGGQLQQDYNVRRAMAVAEGRDPIVDPDLSDIQSQMQKAVQRQLDKFEERLKEMGVDPEAIRMIMEGLRGSGFGPRTQMPMGINWTYLMSNFKTEMDIEVGTQPLSSWTTDPHIASGFGSYVYRIIVPAERVWSTALTGAGCLPEKELVLVGGVDRARIARSGA